MAFSPDGKYLAGSGEKGMTIWRLSPGERTGEDRPRPTFEPMVRVPVPMAVCVAFSPDGGLVAFVHEFRGVHLWDLILSATGWRARTLRARPLRFFQPELPRASRTILRRNDARVIG